MATPAVSERAPTVLVTGATGLVGSAVIERLVRHAGVHVMALVRRPSACMAASLRTSSGRRVTQVVGDMTRPGLGIAQEARRLLARSVSHVVHCAADTSFSRPLARARAVNTEGTAQLLDLMTGWKVQRLVHVSTAFVAGARTGVVVEDALDDEHGFVNAYEQSKYEAELLVRRSGVAHVVVRPSTIVCDDTSGRVSQYNAVHRALRVFHAGYGSIVPGAEDAPVDLVTTDYVAEGVAASVLASDASGTFHLCAGSGAMALAELLDRAHSVWSRVREWRRRGILRPAITDLPTYRLFEEAVAQTEDGRLAAITRSLSHFVPQLALPKRFETARADALLGAAPPVRSFWDALVAQLVATRWGVGARRAA